jgi:hypothetical protein
MANNYVFNKYLNTSVTELLKDSSTYTNFKDYEDLCELLSKRVFNVDEVCKLRTWLLDALEINLKSSDYSESVIEEYVDEFGKFYDKSLISEKPKNTALNKYANNVLNTGEISENKPASTETEKRINANESEINVSISEGARIPEEEKYEQTESFTSKISTDINPSDNTPKSATVEITPKQASFNTTSDLNKLNDSGKEAKSKNTTSPEKKENKTNRKGSVGPSISELTKILEGEKFKDNKSMQGNKINVNLGKCDTSHRNHSFDTPLNTNVSHPNDSAESLKKSSNIATPLKDIKPPVSKKTKIDTASLGTNPNLTGEIPKKNSDADTTSDSSMKLGRESDVIDHSLAEVTNVYDLNLNNVDPESRRIFEALFKYIKNSEVNDKEKETKYKEQELKDKEKEIKYKEQELKDKEKEVQITNLLNRVERLENILNAG